MATTLASLKEYIKRRLGDPLNNIEIADTQMDDCIKEALDHFKEYHVDGTDEAVYLLSVTDGTSLYTLPTQIEQVIRVFPDSDFLTTDGEAFEIPVYWSGMGYPAQYGSIPYMIEVSIADMQFVRTQMALVDKFFEKNLRFDFNATTKRFALYEAPSEDKLLALKVFQSDTDVTKLYDNKWFKKYAIALCGIQWGVNLTKFTNVSLPGGAQMNGEQIEARYLAQKEALEEELERYIEPTDIYVG
jgi:hypothetical protein